MTREMVIINRIEFNKGQQWKVVELTGQKL